MPGFKLFKKFLRGPNLSFFRVIQALTDAFLRIDTGGNIEQSLIGLGILDDGRRLPLHGEHHRALASLLSCFMKSPERRRKVVSDWMSLVMSSMSRLLVKAPF